MRKVTLILAGISCIGLAAPSFAAQTPLAPSGAQITGTPCQTDMSDQPAKQKKAKKSKKSSKSSSSKKETTGSGTTGSGTMGTGTTSRSSWGG